ncbi:anaerobic ribonucleoside-triphosphate reductase [Staphylococcus aureus]
MGYIGLYETAIFFYGPTGKPLKKQKPLHFKNLQRNETLSNEMDRIMTFGSVFTNTPSKSLTDRFVRFRRRDLEMKTLQIKDIIKNSFHYDVRKDVTPFEKLDFEEDILIM